MASQRPILAFIDRNQILISRNVLLGIYICHLVGARYWPLLHKHTDRFFHLQYLIDRKGGTLYFDIGINDAYYVAYWVILLSFMRASLMQWCFEPVAKHLCRIHSKKARVRFAEQSWLVVYYCGLFALGFYLYYHSPYWNNLDNIYAGWPHYRMSLLFKKYYLVSIAFWLQQVVVLNIEAQRKDHLQMFSHHIITIALVIGLYYYYYNRVGNLILMIMDSVDIFLSTAKILKYSGFLRLCDIMFLLFLVAWIILRHGVYNYLLYHTWKYAYALLYDSRCIAGTIQKRCLTPNVINGFLCLLGGLQVITIVWMYLILKVAKKVVMGQNAEDVRSDEEDTDVEDNGHEDDTKSDDSTNTDDMCEKEEEISNIRK